MKRIEMWKDIKGYEGRYRISSFGRVKSLVTNKMLKPDRRNAVDLRKDGKRETVKIDKLVKEYFDKSRKTYVCDRCHKVLKKEKPIRFLKQEYGVGNYNQYHQVDHYDICSKCYISFEKWLVASRKRKKDDLEK